MIKCPEFWSHNALRIALRPDVITAREHALLNCIAWNVQRERTIVKIPTVIYFIFTFVHKSRPLQQFVALETNEIHFASFNSLVFQCCCFVLLFVYLQIIKIQTHTKRCWCLCLLKIKWITSFRSVVFSLFCVKHVLLHCHFVLAGSDITATH